MYQLILCFCDPLSWNVFTFCWFCDPLCCFSSPKWECVEPKLDASSRMLIKHLNFTSVLPPFCAPLKVCHQFRLLVKLSTSLTVPIWGRPIGAQLSFVSTNGSSPPNWDTQRGNWKKRKNWDQRRKVLPSPWKVKRVHQKRIQKLVDICGRANPSKKVSCNQFSLSWDLSKIPQPLSGGHRIRLTIRE